MIKNNKNLWFTLIEILVWILIVSIVMIGGFQALWAVTIGKSRIIQQTDIQKESFYFTQKLFETIKNWGTIDYEEYFNRKVIWDSTYSSWHFSIPSWFWNYWPGWIVWTSNYWSWFYECTSLFWNKMTWTWCINTYNSWSVNYFWKQQRFWQYSFQFIDYNSNYDDDNWDEDGDWNIKYDDDDEYLWDWPGVFETWTWLTELYLISWNKKERTLFRWNVYKDPEGPSSASCSLDWTNTVTWTGCIWTVEYLKLSWRDFWMDHELGFTDTTENDWVIDTWIVDPSFTWNQNTIAWSWSVDWVNLFPSSINVYKFDIKAYPNKDIKNAWKNTDVSVNISPYIELWIWLKPSWKTRKKMKSEWKKLDFSMTINLSEIYSQ